VREVAAGDQGERFACQTCGRATATARAIRIAKRERCVARLVTHDERNDRNAGSRCAIERTSAFPASAQRHARQVARPRRGFRQQWRQRAPVDGDADRTVVSHAPEGQIDTPRNGMKCEVRPGRIARQPALGRFVGIRPRPGPSNRNPAV
jgi:antitoxin (DNA-binding transcriptional repressor) of toxin-antitoxin stability system